MLPIYIIEPPEVHAGPPRRWNISSLAIFRECPRRWWLLNSRYSKTPDGKYPVPYGSATLRGRLVHGAVEAYAKSVWSSDDVYSGTPFSPRQHLKGALRAILENADENPRTDPRRLSVSLDDCVRDFYDLMESQDPPQRPTRLSSAEPSTNDRPLSAPSEAAELWLEVEAPPVGGRIDRVVNYGLVDFKTGTPSDSHAEQVNFYAALWWLKYGIPPRTLELRYTGGVGSVEVPVPSVAELRAIVERLSAEIVEVNQSLSSSPAPARPSCTTCVRCPVRQLCDEYWDSPETVSLRSPRPSTAESKGPSFCDARIVDLSSQWIGDGHWVGPARADLLGEVQLFVEREKCPIELPVKPKEARLLSAMIHAGANRPEIRATSGTEVFWVLTPEE